MAKAMNDIIQETQKNMYERLESDPFFKQLKPYRLRAGLAKKLGDADQEQQYLVLAEKERKYLLPKLLQQLLQYSE
ncbi:MAG: hypothetical protein U9Q69_01280 [Nanoarchaeota archaeon]|nr:hypothetical protein [Nanoarchaeota archaeon]